MIDVKEAVKRAIAYYSELSGKPVEQLELEEVEKSEDVSVQVVDQVMEDLLAARNPSRLRQLVEGRLRQFQILRQIVYRHDSRESVAHPSHLEKGNSGVR